MSIADPTRKAFEPGTSGWTAADLDDWHIEDLWLQGRYEIVDGVLTKMPPAYFGGGKALFNLMFLARKHQKQLHLAGSFSFEVDMILDEDRVAVADAVWMTPAEEQAQAGRSAASGRIDPARTRILVPPSLVIESISIGHERHDRNIKRRWYGEFGVQNYWILNAFDRSLECLVLNSGKYETAASGRGAETVTTDHPFPGLSIPLAELWES